MFVPAEINLEAYRNGVLRTQFTLFEENVAVDLSGYGIKMQVRNKPGAPDPPLAEAETGAPSADGSVITIVDAANGVFEVFLSNLDFQDISIPEGDSRTLAYDILFKTPSINDLLPLIKGSFKIHPGVTIQS